MEEREQEGDPTIINTVYDGWIQLNERPQSNRAWKRFEVLF